MGSLVVKLDTPTMEKLRNRHHYSDIDVLSFRGSNLSQEWMDKNLDDNDGIRRKVGEIVQEVPMVYDVEAVKVSVRNILMWRVGESILRPEFGHNLKRSMYQQMNDFNKDKVCEEIKRAIEENEPRVDIKTVDAKREDVDDENNALNVKVVYTVVGNKTDDAEFTEQTTILGK